VRYGAGKTCLTVARVGEATTASAPIESIVRRQFERWLRFFAEPDRHEADALPHWMQTELERTGSIRSRRRNADCPLGSTDRRSDAVRLWTARGGLGRNPGQRADRKAVGPHSGPYRSRSYPRVRCADPTPVAGVTIEAARGGAPSRCGAHRRYARSLTPRGAPYPPYSGAGFVVEAQRIHHRIYRRHDAGCDRSDLELLKAAGRRAPKPPRLELPYPYDCALRLDRDARIHWTRPAMRPISMGRFRKQSLVIAARRPLRMVPASTIDRHRLEPQP
jgi:hypothetical protein